MYCFRVLSEYLSRIEFLVRILFSARPGPTFRFLIFTCLWRTYCKKKVKSQLGKAWKLRPKFAKPEESSSNKTPTRYTNPSTERKKCSTNSTCPRNFNLSFPSRPSQNWKRRSLRVLTKPTRFRLSGKVRTRRSHPCLTFSDSPLMKEMPNEKRTLWHARKTTRHRYRNNNWKDGDRTKI